MYIVVTVYWSPRPAAMPEEYRADVWPLWYVAFAFLHNRRFGVLFVLGLTEVLAVEAERDVVRYPC